MPGAIVTDRTLAILSDTTYLRNDINNSLLNGATTYIYSIAAVNFFYSISAFRDTCSHRMNDLIKWMEIAIINGRKDKRIMS